LRAVNMIFVIICGIVGLWGGYWLGHLAGWSENADWPAQIGGGWGALILSVVLALAAMVAATVCMCLPTFRTTRRLLRDGTPVTATVLAKKRAGLTIRSTKAAREKVCCRLEIRPATGEPFETTACQFMTLAEESVLLPEAVVNIRYDPKNPARAAIEGRP
jgi:hypothetical protein